MKTTEKKARLSAAAQQLMFIAARSHSLAEFMGLEFATKEDGGELLKFTAGVKRPWLVTEHDETPDVLTFDADVFARARHQCSEGEAYMRVWLLNVWNPGYAKRNEWHFDLFRALDVLDEGNRAAIAKWMENPVWP